MLFYIISFSSAMMKLLASALVKMHDMRIKFRKSRRFCYYFLGPSYNFDAQNYKKK